MIGNALSNAEEGHAGIVGLEQALSAAQEWMFKIGMTHALTMALNLSSDPDPIP